MLAIMNILLAQSASLDGAMSEGGLGIIARFLCIIAVIVIAHGGWQVRSGNADMGKMSIVGGLLLGLAVVIADALFQVGGMPTIAIGR
jgi:TRAP-type C4-dicarboxylate transport system permease small subunit